MSVNKTQQTVKSSQHLTGATFVGVVFYFAHILQQAFAKDATLSNDAIFNSSATMVSEDNEVTDTIMASTNGLKSVQAESSSLQSTEPTLVGSFSTTTTLSSRADHPFRAVDAQDEEESPVEPYTYSYSLALITTLAVGIGPIALDNSNDDDVEILQGPAVTLYGSNAVGGVMYETPLSPDLSGPVAGATDDAASSVDAATASAGVDATVASSLETPELQVDGVAYTFPLGAVDLAIDSDDEVTDDTASALDAGDGDGVEFGFGMPGEFEEAINDINYTFPVGDWSMRLGEFAYSNFYDTGDVASITPSDSYGIAHAYAYTESDDGVDSLSFSISVDASSQAPDEGRYVVRLGELSLEDGSAQELVLTYDPDGFGLSMAIVAELTDETPGDDGYSAEIEGVAIPVASEENDAYVTTLQGFQPWSEAIPLTWVPSITDDLESQGYELGNVIGEVGIGTLHQVIRPTGAGEEEIESEDYESFYVALQLDDVGLQFDDERYGVSTGNSNYLDEDEEYYIYEASYAYPLNDGMTITPAVFSVEAQDDDHTGIMVTTSFSF